ncbi:hypothetical protein [Pseudoxanthomonas sp.]|uniref:hypothetical protein n=1 Tax=Pseudoxanthomonas sp. TaxID=1871049 RepID=UPI00260B8B1C|nr:hypothetical protein [Pseudoxanthomonas sp.]WDS36235.1 MAG: hypothetical protein O8I58_18520 [Pseudoxanthomonas sp.]
MSDLENAQTGAEVVPAENTEAVERQQVEGSEATAEQVEQPQAQEQPRDEKGRYVPQERLNEVTKARRTAERERDAYRAELEQVRQQRPVPPPQADAPPALESFDFDMQKWQQATAKYYADAAAKGMDSRYREEEQQRSRQESVKQFERKAKEFMASAPDYEDRVQELDGAIQFAPEVIDVIATSDHGPALAYHLATHLDEADRISRLSPHLAALQLGRLEAQISAPKQKPVTQAPPPTPSLSGGSAAPRGIREGMTYEQYKAARMGGK